MRASRRIPLDRKGRRFLDLDSILGESPRIGRESLVSEHWRCHPRFEFFKTLPTAARLLDLGAGSGGLHYWRFWGEPNREDITICGVDKSPDGFESLYDDSQIADLEMTPLKFADSSFDGIIMSHILEHIENTDLLLAEALRVLKPGGRLYVETPAPDTVDMVSSMELARSDVYSSTFNFFDDVSHVRPWGPEELAGCLGSLGLAIMKHGKIEGPSELAVDLLRYGIHFSDRELTTYGLWRLTGWCSYLYTEMP